MSMSKQRGFSLLELMVVIVILGILATIVVPNVFGNKETADRQKVVSDLTALENAMEMYNLENGNYPTSQQGLEALVSEPQVNPRPRNYRTGGYIRRLPNDPWNSPYQLVSPGQNGRYDIFSMGPDGQAGTQDDIGTWNMNDTSSNP
ncbi:MULTISPECIES: type II secretion system major pseudopilin GspG [Gammaproteobacteria]|uniref:type II secretion system major pseudopilin GspG n=1 Tax=Gammaproteobacteria TaxID=1236 RepID=UPI000DD05050|nr:MULTISPECIES: type II secretion system major pseudopilin GspG [Gammaproteobacteria]RTE86202.1 type II secretion system protein GspG [Aliidiomarina sp. B3213]TCZ91554.1 type II secretion system protein GspG [Lysobacter sp. N42]